MDIYGLTIAQVRNSMRKITTVRDEDHYYSEYAVPIDFRVALLRATALAAAGFIVLSMPV
ncbi:hypothetical protein J2735_000014 [Agrobacterium tumefaciens]|nr:hypothetical protein [Agrobacterium tumefaciens]